MLRKYIGDRNFYRKVMLLAVPVMIQNGITNFVALLDNIMVGRVGTDQMSAVAIVNQLIFVYCLGIFGGLSGAGIFTAQYFGRKDYEGIRETVRLKMIIAGIVLTLGLLLLISMGGNLIRLFLHEGGQTGDIEQTLLYAKQYLKIMLWGLLPFAINQIYAGTLRETGETFLPMVAGIIAVFVNLTLNAILIFGMLGAPALGVRGAAIATVISRYVELLVVIVWTRLHKPKYPYLHKVLPNFTISRQLTGDVIRKGTPLLINEVLWSAGMATLNQSYAMRGLATVAAINICSTISNLFNIAFIAMGSSIAILVGQLLGAGKMEEARETDTRLIAFSVFCSSTIAVIMVLTSSLFPRLYNTTQEVRQIAVWLIRITALLMPINAATHACYFTLRSGGKTMITLVFDSAYMFVVVVPTAYVLSRYTPVPILPLFLICQSLEIFKCLIGLRLVKTDIWIKNIVAGNRKDGKA